MCVLSDRNCFKPRLSSGWLHCYSVCRNLTEEDLDAIGVTLAGHRKRLLMEAKKSVGANLHSSAASAHQIQSAEQGSQIAPPTHFNSNTPVSANIDSLNSVLGELHAFSAVSVRIVVALLFVLLSLSLCCRVLLLLQLLHR